MINEEYINLRGVIANKIHVPDESSEENPPSYFHVIKVHLESSSEEDVEVRVTTKDFDECWINSNVNLRYYPGSKRYELEL